MDYRNDLEAARARRNALARELRVVDRELDELAALSRRRSELERELKAHADEMDRARAKLSLPLLSTIKIASPCAASWDDMDGDDLVRHCDQCDKSVYDLSAMTAEQAESLLRDLGESLCVRFYRRADGTVITGDCPIGTRRKRRRNVAAAAVLSALVATGIGGYLLSSIGDTSGDTVHQAEGATDIEEEDDERERPRSVMGGVTFTDCPVFGCD